MDLPIKLLFFYLSAVIFALFLAFCILLIATTNEYPMIVRSKKEKEFIDPVTGDVVLFPSINDESSVQLSVVVPAYNEEERLSPMLEECVKFLETRSEQSEFTYEIIIVSDGSTDDTLKVANMWCEQLGTNKLRVLELETNRGKGGAVRLGVQSARGAVILFADADGATKFPDLTKLEKSLSELIGVDYRKGPKEASEKLAIIVGSRAHLEKEAVAKRSFFRTILMAFDVELLYIAQTLNIPVAEIAVNWTEIEGSKLTPFWSALQMGKDLGLIWLRYLIGAWKIKDQKFKKE
ncbi:dolichyl-phosphate beta-glucosyltransferase [Asbolus verrucosus]|uniref:dolichyl-phosphate beta-glucosyltransferase n=1 Tax=Asbolus verrucosus TaxID=1661398 RepID=A0A482VII9_ASBVE|nr:dolichyl-phosphate beta-glucosyltransferase [Asbolus verrucosus]